jgi:hypothetical protein
MTKDIVLKLRYLGMIPQVGHREYGFRVENKDKEFRQVVVTIDNTLFLKNHLMFQEAPDLCYQRVFMDVDNEPTDAAAGSTSTVPITEMDIARYRDSHPTASTRQKPGLKRSEHTWGSPAHR